MAYRNEAEQVVDSSEQRLYRFEWVSLLALVARYIPLPLIRHLPLSQIPSHQALTMQLLGPNDSTLDVEASPQTNMDYYVSSYVLNAPTEGLEAKVEAPFLKRYVPLL